MQPISHNLTIQPGNGNPSLRCTATENASPITQVDARSSRRALTVTENPAVVNLALQSNYDFLHQTATVMGMQVLSASSAERTDVLASIHDVVEEFGTIGGAERFQQLMPTAEKAIREGDKNKLDSVIAMLELMAVMIAVLQSNRQVQSAKFGETASEMTGVQNKLLVNAAVSEVTAAAVAFVAAGAVSGVGVKQVHKGSTNQINNLRTNARKANDLSRMGRDAKHALNTPGTNMDSAQTRLNTVSGEKGRGSVAKSGNHLTDSEYKVIGQSLDRPNDQAKNLRLVQEENATKFSFQQASGHAITGMSSSVSNMVQSGGSYDAANKNAEANLAAAAAKVMENLQSAEGDLSTRLKDKLYQVFSQIGNLQAAGIQLLSSMMPVKG